MPEATTSGRGRTTTGGGRRKSRVTPAAMTIKLRSHIKTGGMVRNRLSIQWKGDCIIGPRRSSRIAAASAAASGRPTPAGVSQGQGLYVWEETPVVKKKCAAQIRAIKKQLFY